MDCMERADIYSVIHLWRDGQRGYSALQRLKTGIVSVV